MRVAICLSLLLVLASCADDSDTKVVASPTPGSGYASEPTEWFLRSISEDGTTIAFVYQMSGVASECEREGRATVAERGERAILTAHKLVTTDKQRACTEELAYVDASVDLEKPLGERLLIGCRPGYLDDSEDEICRDLERSREAGVFEFSPAPSG